MSLRLQAWTPPGVTSFEKRIETLQVIDASGKRSGLLGVGSGRIVLASDFEDLSLLIDADPSSPADDISSMIRVWDDLEDGTSEWVHDWLLEPVEVPLDEEGVVAFSGPDIKAALAWAWVEAWDWDGSATWQTVNPDWIYLGRNIMRNPGFEDSAPSPIEYRLAVVPDLDSNGDPLTPSGTYTLSDGTNTTAAIDWDEDNPVIIEAALEGFAAIDDVNVTGTGTPDDPFVIEFVEPFEGITLTAADSITNATIELPKMVFGSLQPSGWTKSAVVSRGKPRTFGEYTNFRVVSTQAHTGSYSLFIDPAPIENEYDRYAGAQQVLTTRPGMLAQAKVWVYPLSGTDTFRFVIRGVDGDFIKAYPGGLTSTTLTANTWNELEINDIDVGTNDRVIFRIANTNPVGSNPSGFYIDDAEWREGQQAATVGKILLDQRASLDLADFLEWITFDFTETLDSNGDAWDEALAWEIRHGDNLLRVVQDFEQVGYEFRMIPDVLEDGTYLLQAFNPEGMGTDYSAVANPSILVGQGTVAGNVQRTPAQYNSVQVLGAGGLTSRANSVANQGVIGKRGLFIRDDSLQDLAAVTKRANAELAGGIRPLISKGVTIAAGPDWPRPIAEYAEGDLLNWDLADGTGKLAQRVGVISYEETRDRQLYYTLFPERETFGGVGAVNEAVRRLLNEPRFPTKQALAQVDLSGGAGAPSVVLAPSDASEAEKDRADLEAPGTDDSSILQEAINAAAGGRLLICSGTIQLKRKMTIPDGTKIEGMGWGTVIRYSGQSGQSVLEAGDACEFESFAFLSASSTEVYIDATDTELVSVRNIEFADTAGFSATGVRVGDRTSITGCYFEGALLASGNANVWVGVVIANNRIPSGSIDMGSEAQYWVIAGNAFNNGAIYGAAGQGTIIQGNTIEQSSPATGTLVLGFTGAAINCAIVENVVANGGGDALQLGTGSTACLIAHNEGLAFGVVVDGVDFCEISDNVIWFPIGPSGHGIRVDDSSDCLIADNLLAGPGDATHDGIFLEGDSDRNLIKGNLIRTAGFSIARYAVNISAATCNANRVVGNDYGDATLYTTDAFNDAGTGTLITWPGDATYGDNFFT